jgi:hypothetical protein
MIKWVKGIVYRDARILIGRLRHKNDLIPRMEWTFPFKKIQDRESPRTEVKKVFNELGLNIEAGKFLLKCIPSENTKVEEYYYESRYKSGILKNSSVFSEFAWVRPTQVLKYFTTSINKDLLDYLRSLEKTGEGVIIE